MQEYYELLNEECLNWYMNTMQKPIDDSELHVNETELLNLHDNAKNESIAKVWKIYQLFKAFILLFGKICTLI